MAKFTDINIKFRPNPITGDLVVISDVAAIQQSLKNIIFSNAYDRPFRSKKSFADGIESSLFTAATVATVESVKQDIMRKILQHEPRIIVNNIDVITIPSEHRMSIVISFKIRTTQQISEVKIQLERV